MYEVAERAKVIEESRIAESLKILESRPEIISLGAGEPDFPAPPSVIKAAQQALSKGYTHYAPLKGKSELREAIAEKLKKENKIDASPDEVIVCCGSKEAILLAMLATVDVGEEVIVPDPGYLAYRPMAEMVGGKAVSLQLREEDGFELNPDAVKKLITDKTRLLVINSPSNPTGNVFRKKLWEEIADIIVDKQLYALCDEAYEKLVYEDAEHVSLGSLNGMEKYVITVQTFSKTYAMCGFRVGYAVAPPELIKEMVEFKICTTISAPTAFQMAAVEALKSKATQKYVEEMRREYDRRRKLLIKRLNEIDRITFTVPKGAFYFFPNITELRMSSEEAVDFLLKKAKVLMVPGTEFGKYGEGYVRLSYATAYEKIVEAMDRIENALK